MGPELIAAASAAAPYLAVGGTIAQMVGAQEQRNKQRRIINRAFDANERDTRQGTQSVVDEATQYAAPDARMKAMQTAEDAAFARTQQDLSGAGGALVDTAAEAGNLSTDFVRAKADRALAEGDRLTAIARELAKVRSPGDVASNDAIRRSGLSERLSSMWNTNRGRSQAAQLDAESVDMPLYGQLGQIASMAGLAAGMAAPAAAAGSAATNPALIESAVGSAGYGASSASAPWWMPKGSALSMFSGGRR